MATATSNHTASKPRTWVAANAYRPKGAGRKWTESMQRELVERVREADRRGTARQKVYDDLSAKWSGMMPEVYTPHQVSSQFHVSKARFGYDVVKQPQGAKKRVRKVTKPPTRTSKPTALVPEPATTSPTAVIQTVGEYVTEAIRAFAEALAEATERAEAAERERDQAQAALARIQDALRS
jgi:hypothetical protein